MQITIRNKKTNETITLDEEQSTMFEEGLLEIDTLVGVKTDSANWNELVTESWE